MANVYSVELYSISNLGGAGAPITCPSGKVMVVRDIDAYTKATLLPSELFVVDITTGGAFAWNFQGPTQAVIYSWRGRQVFSEGLGFQARADSGTWDVRVSGYLLDA